MSSFVKVDSLNNIGLTTCCQAYVKVSDDGATMHCVKCKEEIVAIPVGKTVEQALMEHAKKTNAQAKITSVSPIRHNAVQLMQEFGDSTMMLAIDQWLLWNIKKKSEEDIKELDALVCGIINVFVMNTMLKQTPPPITAQDIAEELYKDKKYLERLCKEKVWQLANTIGFSVADMLKEMIEVCVHPPLKGVLNDFYDTELDKTEAIR